MRSRCDCDLCFRRFHENPTERGEELLDRIARWDARLSGVGSSVLLFWLRTPMFHNRGISSCDLMETE